MSLYPARQESRWKLRTKGKFLYNICSHVIIYGAVGMCLNTAFSTDLQANPQGGTVVAGSASISSAGSELQINQSSNKAIIDWSSFNIDAGETTRFIQPGSDAIALNRVVNSTQLSTINGNLIANGRVMVINPNGILIGPSGNIDTAGFVASTADIDNDKFMNAERIFEFNKAGNWDATVENQGMITVQEAGIAALVAPTVKNSGVIQGQLSKVQMAAADTYAIDFYGDGLISFAVDSDGKTSRQLSVSNSGSLIANGGSVLMTAAAASNVVESVINTDGLIQAGSLQNVNGKIVLTAEGADINVSGALDVAAIEPAAGGGEIYVGGALSGGDVLPKARSVHINSDASLVADAGEVGDGGTIVVWSDERTVSNGSYSAQGGSVSGNGGLVETSSADILQVSGSSVNTLAANGDTGSWLLDPATLTVYETGSPNIDNISGIDVADINAALSDVLLLADNSITFSANINITEPGINITARAGVAGSDIDGLAAGTGTISISNQFIRTEGGDITFISGDSISQNNATTYTNGGDIYYLSGDISINNNAAMGTVGGNVTLIAIAAGTGSNKTSGTVTTNSTFIDTSSNTAPGIGGITLTDEDGNVLLDDYGNPQNFFVQDSNGGSITIEGKSVGGNSVCFAAGGSGCLVPDPVATNIIITADFITREYGQMDPILTYTYTGTLQGGDTFTGTLLRDVGEDVGLYAINQGSLTVDGSGLYNITYVGNFFEITPADLQITANSQSKTYGDVFVFNGTEFSVTGGTLFFSDSVDSATLASLGAVGTAGVGDYDINISNAVGTGLSNYNISYVPGVLTVDPALLTIMAQDQGKTYGDTFNFNGTEFTTSGLVNSDTVDSVSLTSAGEINTANVGDYDIEGSNAIGSGLANYTINYVDGTLTVSPAELTITANDDSKVYDAVAYNGGNGVMYSGFVNGENDSVLGGVLSYGGDSQGATNVGTYTITASGLTSGNYNITYIDGDLDITPADLVITANDQSKTYGDTFSFTGSEFMSSGLFGSDSVDSVSLTSAGAVNTANVGDYDIEASNASGSGLSNYSISYVDGTLTVDPADLTVTANDDSKVYDAAAYSGGNGVMYSGFVNGENEGVLGGMLAYGGDSQGATNVGTYTIEASGLTSSNYNIIYIDGSLDITVADLTITANDASKTYGDVLVFGGSEFMTSGLLGSDSVDSVDLYSAGAVNTANVGDYDIEGSNASGTGLSNYSITYVDGTLTVNPAELTITANDDSKVYDAVAYSGGNGVMYSGFVNGENDSVLSGTLAYGGDSQGATNVGSYTIEASGLSSGNYNITYVDGNLDITPADLLIVTPDNQVKTYGDTFTFLGTEFTTSGLLGGDSVDSVTLTSDGAVDTAIVGGYDIDSADAVGTGLGNYNISYATGTLTVNPAELTVTANDDGKVYDALAYNGGNGVMYSGFVNGENEGVLGGMLAYGGDSQGATNVGSYTIEASGLTSGNYNITYVDGNLDITPADLVITANDQSKTYGDTFTFTGSEFMSSGLLGSDSVNSVSLTSAGAVNTANVGDYDIEASSALGTGLSNYSISYVDGTLSVDPAELTITANDDSKVYDAVAYSDGNGVMYSGFVNGENEGVLGGMLAYGGDSQGATNVGTYTIEASGYTSSNYNITYIDGSLEITVADLTITSNDASKTYGDVLVFGGSEFMTSGLLGSDSVDSVDLYSDGAVNTANVGDYDIAGSNASGTGLSNYSITYVDGTLTVNPAELTVTANDDSKTYDAVAYSGGNGVMYSGFVNSESEGVLGGMLTYGGDSQGATNVGIYTITASGLTSTNYNITYVDGNLDISTAELTIYANNQVKTYGQNFTFNGTEFTTSGLQGSDSVDSVSLSSFGSPNTADAGYYSIENAYGSASGTGLSNYEISYVDGVMTVNPAPLTITANDDSKQFDNIAYFGGNGVTYSGFVNGENESVLYGTLVYGGSSQGAVNEGNYSIVPSGLSATPQEEFVQVFENYDEPYFEPFDGGNYVITYVSGTLTITSPDPVIPTVELDPLGRPIISVANQAIVLNEQFEEIETLELETNVSIAGAQTLSTPEVLAGITPAAGGTSAEDLAGVEPAAGGDATTSPEDEELSRDLECGNNFLDNTPCDIEGQL